MKDTVHHLSHLLTPPAFAVGGEMNGIAMPFLRRAAIDGAGDSVVRPNQMNGSVRVRRHELRLTRRAKCLICEHRQLATLSSDRAKVRRPLLAIRHELIAIPRQPVRARNLRIPARRNDAALRPAIALALHPVERLHFKLHPRCLRLLHRTPRIIQTRLVIPAAMPPRLRRPLIHR